MHSGALTCMQPHLHGMHLHPIPVSSNPQPAAQENQVEPFYLIKQQDSVDPGRCPCIRAYSGACILLFYMTVHALAGSPVLPLLVSVRDGIRVVASGRVQADVHAFGRINVHASASARNASASNPTIKQSTTRRVQRTGKPS
jgi:hypothetical protein